MENGAKIEIKITDKDTGHVTKIEKDYEFYPDLGWECTFPAEFAKLVCQMMDLLGYCGYKKDYVFLEGIDIEEYDSLLGYLDDIRDNKKEQIDE